MADPYKAAQRARVAKAGGARVDVYLTPEAVAALAKLTSDGSTKIDAINRAIIAASKKIKSG